LSNIIWIVVIGFIAGVIARFLSPGPNEPSGFILTTVLGIVGAFVATFIGQIIGWYRLDQGAGLIGATVGAVIVLFIWNRLVVHHVLGNRDVGAGSCIKSLILRDFLRLNAQSYAITAAKQLAMPVVATGVIVDAIAVANVQAVLGAVVPDRALHEPRKRRRERRIELASIDVRRK
jgi:uncharacterized membrane protein YeaQ/YmgE (transglycosylase-associated protein family)